ncbi:MAG: hypothetical protein JHD35_05035 [Sphingopyxis sp.]|nr:hypothetical protein [Sphingopyxis sp.]
MSAFEILHPEAEGPLPAKDGAFISTTPPTHWHRPEKVAAHIVGAPGLWEGGMQLMQARNPDAYRAISAAAAVWHVS